MDRQKVAIISYFFSESTLVLSKYLSQHADVDYYFIASLRETAAPGIVFKKTPKLPGLFKIKDKVLTDFLSGDRTSAYLIRLINHSEKKKYYWLNSTIIKFIITKLNRKAYDYVNIVGHQDILLLFHKLIRCRSRIHTLHEVVDHLNSRFINKEIYRYLYNSDIKIIVHSANTYNELNKARANRARNFHVNFGLFESYKMFKSGSLLEAQRDYVLFYGLFRPYKGLDSLLSAIRMLRAKGFKHTFIVAGFGTDSSLSELKKLNDVFVMNKYLSNEEICELNARAKIVICPYKSTSQSGIVMTSFLFNKPVIATRIGGFPEVIDDRGNGLLVRPDAPDELANAIELIYSDDELYRKMILNISDFSKKEPFNWKRIAETTFQIFKTD